MLPTFVYVPAVDSYIHINASHNVTVIVSTASEIYSKRVVVKFCTAVYDLLD